MISFAELQSRFRWVPLHGCPGRFVLRGAPADLSPEQLLGTGVALRSFRVPAAADQVLVAVLDGGGLLSYRREDGSFLHTLNTPEGLARKLAQLGIRLEPEPGAALAGRTTRVSGVDGGED